MDQLINLVVQKTGIPADTARTAVETVLGFLKDKLPAPIASQIEGVIGGGGSGDGDGKGGDIGDIAKGIGGMFGSK